MTISSSAKSLPLPPGRFGLPLIGESIAFVRNFNTFAAERFQKYGPVFKTHLLGRPTVVVMGADASRFVLTNENQYFTGSWPISATQLLGQGSLVIQKGDEHQQRRKMLSQAFQPRMLTTYMAEMDKMTQHYLEQWAAQPYVVWHSALRRYTFAIACKLLVGIEVDDDSPLPLWFETFTNGLFTLPLPLPWTQFGQALHARQRLLAEIDRMIQDKQPRLGEGRDALDMLLQAQDEAGDRLSLDEIKDQLLTLLFGGHETLTSGLTITCLLLSQYPEVLAAIRAEQETVVGAGPITLEHLKQMTYLEQVLKEVLRLFPPAAGAFREVLKDCEIHGYHIPQGWSLLYRIVNTQLDSHVFQDADQFDPDRFGSDRAEDKAKPFSHIPFGGGARECIGREFARLEMRLFISHLVRHYTWELLPGQNLDISPIPMPHPVDGLKVKLKKIA